MSGFLGNKDYDKTNPFSIEEYSQQLIGRKFSELIYFSDFEATEDYTQSHENKNRKGGLGEYVEECFFHYKANSDSEPDFKEAGVELKVTPYKINKNKTLSSKERLIITMIDYCSVVNEDFEKSGLWKKSKLILLIYYLYQKEIKDRMDYRIDYSKLFTPPESDLEIIKNDFIKIITKIKEGKAHELSEGDTLYLGAATKAATSKNLRKQPFSDILAKPRAFSFKNSYMTYVLNNYIVKNINTSERILKEIGKYDLEKIVTQKIDDYKNYTQKELCEKFGVEKKTKQLGAILAYRILGIKGNSAEEFEKANIVIKTIRINKNNKINESMSFPNFKYKELVLEQCATSTFISYLEETKFLFIVYKEDNNGEFRLIGSQFWNMPIVDIESKIYPVWNETRNVLIRGLEVERKNNKDFTNFPGMKFNGVCHVRPHAKNKKDTYELPDGRNYMKHCFWLNNTYILRQLDKKFLEEN